MNSTEITKDFIGGIGSRKNEKITQKKKENLCIIIDIKIYQKAREKKISNMNLVEHAKMELQIAGLLDENSEYGGMIGEAVIELIEVFSKQGHSGASAPIVINLFKKLVKFEPLEAITGKDEEWALVGTKENGSPWYQNKRCSALFKEGQEGRAYYLDAIVKRDQNGNYWSGFAWLNEEDFQTGDRTKMIGKRGYIKSFPFIPKTFYIDVKEVEISKDDWESFVTNPAQLEEIREYYDLL